MWVGVGMRQVGSKILPHSRPTTFAEWGKPAWGEAGSSRAKLPSLVVVLEDNEE